MFKAFNDQINIQCEVKLLLVFTTLLRSASSTGQGILLAQPADALERTLFVRPRVPVIH